MQLIRSDRANQVRYIVRGATTLEAYESLVAHLADTFGAVVEKTIQGADEKLTVMSLLQGTFIVYFDGLTGTRIQANDQGEIGAVMHVARILQDSK